MDNTIPFSNPETAQAFHKKYRGKFSYTKLLELTRDQVLERIRKVAKTTCFPPPEAEIVSMVRLLDNIKVKVRLPANVCKPEALITMKLPVAECLGCTAMLRRAAEEAFFKREVWKGRTFPAFVFPGITRKNSGVGYFAYTSRVGHIKSVDGEPPVLCPGEYSLFFPEPGFHCTAQAGAVATTVIFETHQRGYYLSDGKWVREDRRRLEQHLEGAHKLVLDLRRENLAAAQALLWESAPPAKKATVVKAFAFFMCFTMYVLMLSVSLTYPEHAPLTHGLAVVGAFALFVFLVLYAYVDLSKK